MPDPQLEPLLRPSLDADTVRVRPPLSSTTQFLTAFLGGPLSLLFCLAISIHRLRRWRQDAAFLAGMTVVLITVALLPWTQLGAPVRDAWLALLGPRSLHLWVTLVASIGSLMAMHRHARERRAADLMGVKSESSLGLGVVLILAGYGLTHAFDVYMGAV